MIREEDNMSSSRIYIHTFHCEMSKGISFSGYSMDIRTGIRVQ